MLVVIHCDIWRTFCYNEDVLKGLILADGLTFAKSRGKNLGATESAGFHGL